MKMIPVLIMTRKNNLAITRKKTSKTSSDLNQEWKDSNIKDTQNEWKKIQTQIKFTLDKFMNRANSSTIDLKYLITSSK